MAIINGTAGDDFLVSSNNGDVVFGLDGNDILEAAHNNVTLSGGSGNDVLFSDAGADSTTMDGGGGDDVLAGGGTNDTASYANDLAGVVVDLPNFSATDGSGGIDTLVGIENITGSAFNDALTGDDLANVLQGGAGNDTLAGNGGADVFKFSFALTQGHGSTSTFTGWLSEKFGTDFGAHLPDYAPTHHDKDDKHGKDDVHNSKDEDHGKNDQHDKQGNDDGHNSKDDDHNHDGGGGDDGHHAPNAGLTEKFFETNYQDWLKEVVVPDLLQQGLVLDANGDGKIKIDINEDSQNGTPRIEGLSKAQLAEMFGDRDSVILNDHGNTEKAWYSNSFTSGNGQDTITSHDGSDKIVDFTWGVDKLEFHGLAGLSQTQFASLFAVTQGDVNGDGIIDTTLALADGSEAVTLVGVSGHTVADFYGSINFS